MAVKTTITSDLSGKPANKSYWFYGKHKRDTSSVCT